MVWRGCTDGAGREREDRWKALRFALLTKDGDAGDREKMKEIGLKLCPDDLAEAYEVPLELVRSGGTLPWSGDFLTGNQPDMTTEAA